MTVEGFKTVFDWGAVILLFLTFAAGVGVLITGNIINERQAERLRQFDRGLTEAKTEQGKQQERAANADARVQGLRLEVAQANEKAERERLARVQIQALVSARHIPPENVPKLSQALSAFKGKSIVLASYANDPESYGLTRSILLALQAVPISVEDISGRQIAVGPSLVGITVFGPPSESTFVTALSDAISVSGRLVMISGAELPDGSPVTVTVGIKPPFFFNDPK